MTVDIFIRTYSKDLKWLEHALRSIHKHVTGFRRIVIAIPDATPLAHLTQETVVQVEDLPDGYIGQQFTKMNAHLYTDSDAVVFWDSDVIACEPVDVSEWFKDKKPIIYKTRYSTIQCPWQPITEKAVGLPVEWEYMRRMPLVYFTDTLRACVAHVEQVHGMSLRDYLKIQPHRAFSEFNVMGAYAERFEADKYAFIDTDSVTMPRNKVHQFWSWSGLDAKDLEQIKGYIG